MLLTNEMVNSVDSLHDLLLLNWYPDHIYSAIMVCKSYLCSNHPSVKALNLYVIKPLTLLMQSKRNPSRGKGEKREGDAESDY